MILSVGTENCKSIFNGLALSSARLSFNVNGVIVDAEYIVASEPETFS